METRVDEIADGIFRLSTYVPVVAPPAGFTFNQFLIRAEQPLLFHTGPRGMFDSIRAAAARVLPPETIRWITFGHHEADENGAMNEWLATSPVAEVAHGHTACMVTLNDQAARPPRMLAHEEAIDLGGKQVRYLDTPHVPHAWESGVLYEETTGTLLCGDLFTQIGQADALTRGDIVGPAAATEDMFRSSSIGPTIGGTVRRLAALAPRTLALMHGPSFAGDCAAALRDLGDDYDRRLRAAMGG
jgi:flavorubredoxin